ncbi:hypothetical protein RhiirC2_789147 [Rhizophagus irregularis]|uniref:F-box domain-containing protein n=1 Tax=Rhizophagus irregularis TaxID=588596 RepID=A0A2N1MNU1_9GLOM|nr:hypothetical protein RhiirC2_789147 [Rhizophagus irregularis]
MSSSKIFSGDLPELMNDIIKYLQNDFSTLHSCILVNRLWCRLAIPLLWENPFSIPTENYNFIEFYLNNLNNDLRSKLNEYKINDNSLPSSTLFNYPSFIKYLNAESIIFSIINWFDTLKPGRRYFLLESDIHSVLEFEKLISMLLFKLFIENEVNLHIFEIEVIENSTYYSYLEDVLELMLQNPNFTHNIRNLKLYISINHDSITNTPIKNRISQVINTHQVLKKIVLCYGSLYLYQSLLLSNNCSNSLNTITFYYINFYDIINLDKVFDQLNVLESVHIVHCYNDFIQQIVNSLTSKPFKLKSLFIIEMTPIESLQLLLQKSSNYLENFGYESGFRYILPYKQQLSELVIKYCKNIKFLDLYEFDYQIICLTLNLIENVRQSLNYLSINICKALFSIGGIERSSIILRNLGQNFPFRLEYLCLTLNIKMNDFEIFLKNSQNTFIKKLLINPYKKIGYVFYKVFIRFFFLRNNVS